MELQKQVTSLEISKRLKELGVKQESLWAWWVATDRDDTPALNRHPDKDCPTCGHPTAPYFEWISAFTVAELGEMLPERINTSSGNADLEICKDSSSKDVGKWEMSYEYTGFEMYGCEIIIRADTEADARGKMLIYLLENSLLPLSSESNEPK